MESSDEDIEDDISEDGQKEQQVQQKKKTNKELQFDHMVYVMQKIMICQNLCQDLANKTFIGTTSEFFDAHRLIEHVQRENPVVRHQELVGVMDRLAENMTKEEISACYLRARAPRYYFCP